MASVQRVSDVSEHVRSSDDDPAAYVHDAAVAGAALFALVHVLTRVCLFVCPPAD